MIELPKICDHAVTDMSYQPDIIYQPGYATMDLNVSKISNGWLSLGCVATRTIS